MHFNIKALIVASLVALVGLALPAHAGEKPNILVMGEDVDKDTVPRSSRIFGRVLDALNNQLGDRGHDTFDETALTLDNFKQGRKRRSDAELIDIARSVRRPPIDIAVLFSIYAAAKDVEYTTKIRIRIEGRILDVRTGRRLGNFEVTSPEQWNAEAPCSRECILAAIGDGSRQLANDLGYVLAEKIDAIVSSEMDAPGESSLSTGYTLIFDNFDADDMLEIEEYLIIFSGYETHRPTYQSATRSEIWYESSIRSAKLSRNLTRMLDVLDMRGSVQFADNTFKVQRITTRGKRRPSPEDNDW